MSVSKLPNKRWRAQVYDASTGRNVSAAKLLGGPASYRTKADAKAAREKARAQLGHVRSAVTVAEFRERWITDPLFAPPKRSTAIHNAERTKAFAARYGALPLEQVTDHIVGEWLTGGKRNGTVPALRAMFNCAASRKAGRIISHNPFANLGIRKTRGNRDKQPATEEQVWAMVRHARQLSGPGFAAWLQVAAFAGMRPGELDALRWERVDFATETIRVVEQFSATTRTWDTPKNGLVRDAILTGPAREALLALPRDGVYCFVPLRAEHFTPSSRAYHWKAVRAAAGWDGTLYLCTRHFFGSYAINVLGLASEDVAICLGHTDGGQLVRQLYGHRDQAAALARARAAFAATGNVRPLRAVRKDAS